MREEKNRAVACAPLNSIKETSRWLKFLSVKKMVFKYFYQVYNTLV